MYIALLPGIMLYAMQSENGPQRCTAERVPTDVLREAMSMHGDYDILATANQGRFSSEVLLRLGREFSEQNPDGGPIYIEPEDWFLTYLEIAEIDEDEAPLPSRMGFENRQRTMIEYRRHRVLEAVKEGPEPTLALNVRTWWDEHENPASSFSFTDTTATPILKVTQRREITYRLLDLDSMIVTDKIEGVSGRPVSGVLGTIFSVIGEGSVKQSRTAYSHDGIQVTRVRSKKVFSKTVTGSVDPDGHTRRGLPPSRNDLQIIEEWLKSPFEIEYAPYEWEPICAVDTATYRQ